ncbi:MAG: hypothetical protein GY851_10615, partial [bacterium]|nr:hypothetical protein [bacterium]
REDTIEKQRTDECKVVVTVTVSYTYKSHTVKTDKDGKVVETCTTYEVVTTVKVVEVCNGTRKEVGTSTHTSMETFCDGQTDDPTTGQTKGFDGTETDTLKYPHGTEVRVEKKGEVVKVTVNYPDGTTDSVSIPKP